MKKYIKIIDNEQVIKSGNKIIINKNGMTTYNPTEDMILADGWIEYVEDDNLEEIVESINEDNEENLLDKAKDMMIENIIKYDSSEYINSFYIDNNRMWFDKSTRVALKFRFESEFKNGNIDTKIWNDGVSFEINTMKAISILEKIEVYASSCYDITQQHIANVKKLDNVDDVESYDYKNGYPIALRFYI